MRLRGREEGTWRRPEPTLGDVTSADQALLEVIGRTGRAIGRLHLLHRCCMHGGYILGRLLGRLLQDRKLPLRTRGGPPLTGAGGLILKHRRRRVVAAAAEGGFILRRR